MVVQHLSQETQTFHGYNFFPIVGDLIGSPTIDYF